MSVAVLESIPLTAPTTTSKDDHHAPSPDFNAQSSLAEHLEIEKRKGKEMTAWRESVDASKETDDIRRKSPHLFE